MGLTKAKGFNVHLHECRAEQAFWGGRVWDEPRLLQRQRVLRSKKNPTPVPPQNRILSVIFLKRLKSNYNFDLFDVVPPNIFD